MLLQHTQTDNNLYKRAGKEANNTVKMGMAHVTSGRSTFTYQDLINSKVSSSSFNNFFIF